MTSRRVVPLAAFVLACTTASCAAIFGFERLSEEPADSGLADAVSDAVAHDGGADAPSGPCAELGVPPPPEDAAAGSRFVLAALRLLDFGVEVDGGRPQVPGFNLDLTCSVDLTSSSCTSTLLPAAFETHARDKTATGIDNAGFSLIEYISRFSDVLSPRGINQGIQDGKYGAVIRIEGWNGEPDDDNIAIELFPAIGVQAGDGAPKPAFDEDDRWVLDSRFQVGGVLEASTIRAARAWVTGGRIVGRFAEIVVPIFIDADPKPFEIRVRDAILTAVLETDGSGRAVLRDGVVSGRWKTSDFLGQVRTIYIEDSNGLTKTVLCEAVPGATLIYNSVKSTICEGRDIRSDSRDNAGEPCDAISAAARIEAYSVKELGTFAPSFDAGVRCADAAIPANDDCP